MDILFLLYVFIALLCVVLLSLAVFYIVIRKYIRKNHPLELAVSNMMMFPDEKSLLQTIFFAQEGGQPMSSPIVSIFNHSKILSHLKKINDPKLTKLAGIYFALSVVLLVIFAVFTLALIIGLIILFTIMVLRV